MRVAGLEPVRLSVMEPKSIVSAIPPYPHIVYSIIDGPAFVNRKRVKRRNMVRFVLSPVGYLKVKEEKERITHIDLCADISEQNESSDLLLEAEKQLLEYFAGKRKAFELPLSLSGTDFRKKVWNAIAAIPYGETRSYKQIAETVGNPRAVRAVGSACNRNPIPIIIPCHRVVGTNTPGGYAYGLSVKNDLLTIERTCK